MPPEAIRKGSRRPIGRKQEKSRNNAPAPKSNRLFERVCYSKPVCPAMPSVRSLRKSRRMRSR